MDTRITHFGRLTVVEVYEYYDQPVFFSAGDSFGSYYLAVMVAQSEICEHWLYVQMSKARFDAVRSGGIDLYTAYTDPESGVVLDVILPLAQDRQVSVSPRSPKDLVDEELPDRSARLSLPTRTLPSAPDPVEVARRTHRDSLYLDLKIPGYSRSEVPAAVLGDFLKYTQATVGAIASGIDGKSAQKTTLPVESELAVTSFWGGSFGVSLAPRSLPDLYGNSLSSESLVDFVTLIDAMTSEDRLRAGLAGHPRIAASILSLLRAVRGRVSGLSANLVTASGRQVRASISSQDIKAAIAAIELANVTSKTEEWIVGRLVGAHLEKRTFEINSRTSGRIAGEIAAQAISSIDGATIGSEYRVGLQREVSVKLATGEPSEKIVLESLERVE